MPVVRCTEVSEKGDEMNVADLLRAVKKHVVTEIIIFVAVVAATVWVTMNTTPSYSASTELMAQYESLSTVASSSVDSSSTSYNQTQTLNSQIAALPNIVRVDSVLQPVIDDLGLHESVIELRSKVTAYVVDKSNLLDISVSDSDPQRATRIVEALADSLNAQISGTADGNQATSPIRLTVVQKASVPTTPDSPNVPANIAIGVMAALVLALLGGIIQEIRKKTVETEDDVRSCIDVPILVSIPKAPTLRGSVPAVIAKPAGHAAEEIRRLATNLAFVVLDRNDESNVLVITSSTPAEGKTTVAANLAAAYAERGESVLLMDADIRHPSVGSFLNLSSGVGLISLLTKQAAIETVIQKYWKPNFHVLPVEDRPTNPALLVQSKAMKSFIKQASAHYDHVIIDTAPMSVANDAAAFSKNGATVLLVVSLGVAAKKSLRDVVQEFNVIGSQISGVALNMVTGKQGSGSGYYYYDDDSNSNKHGKARRSKAKSSVTAGKTK